jgi:hypothetical protein
MNPQKGNALSSLLSWPAVVLVIVLVAFFLFEGPLREAIGRTETAKFDVKGGKLEFILTKADVKKLEGKLAESKSPGAEIAPVIPKLTPVHVTQLLAMDARDTQDGKPSSGFCYLSPLDKDPRYIVHSQLRDLGLFRLEPSAAQARPTTGAVQPPPGFLACSNEHAAGLTPLGASVRGFILDLVTTQISASKYVPK